MAKIEENNLSELAEILNVPIITTGVFQGHKGPPVVIDTEKFQKMLKGSNRFQPYLKEAMQTGAMPGNPDFFDRLQKPMPAPITLNHEVLEDDKIKESLKDIQVEFSEELIPDEQNPNGKPWIVEKFSGVNPLAADIIRRFFPKCSAEILELNDPETGERLPVIISTAFLSNKEIRPAVPGQSDSVLVEFSGWNESHYVINTNEPLTQGVNNMADKPKKDESADVSELQAMKETLTVQEKALIELQAKFDQAEAERKKALEFAKICGYPVMIKASAGGGGRGMRIVRSEEFLLQEYRNARNEAKKAFGNEDIFIEKYLEKPKHIEVQVLGDSHGNCVHLFERDCSIQRRHQKVIEITPALSITAKQREAMCNDALKIANAVNYRNAGTVEFVYDTQSGEFYFLEVNTRLQVEHGVTEEVTGVDLVEWMVSVAAGETRALRHYEYQPKGHAIQGRLYAGDPGKNF